MTVKEELLGAVEAIAKDSWLQPDGIAIPAIEDLTFGNTGRQLDITIFYADITDSTKIVDELAASRAAEYYKAFLHCASRLIRENGGEIEAYDGDRVMAVFIGDQQANSAVKAAMQLNYAMIEIINPTSAAKYPKTHRPLQFTVGIDSGVCLAIKIGVRSVAELSWIGPAANYAAKLNSFEGLDHDYPIRVTETTHAKLTRPMLHDRNGEDMWSQSFTNLKNRPHRRTRHHWPFE